MTLSNTIKKAERLSGQKIQTNYNNLHWVEYKNYTVSFYPNGRMAEDVEATNFYTKKIGYADDYMNDYFAGTFHDNITKAFKFLDRR